MLSKKTSISIGIPAYNEEKNIAHLLQLLLKQNQDKIDFLETGEAGLALIEMMSGYKRVLLLDAIATGKHPAGTVIEFKREDFSKVVAPSPHYAGIPEVFEMAERFKIPFPEEVKILAMEVENPFDFNEEKLTSVVEKAFPNYFMAAKKIILNWL